MHCSGDFVCSTQTVLCAVDKQLLCACLQVTATELMSWRALLQLQPEAVLMLARASVHDHTILRIEQLRYGASVCCPAEAAFRDGFAGLGRKLGACFAGCRRC